MFRILSYLLIKDYQNTESFAVKLAYIRLVSWVSIIINVLQSVVKLILGYKYHTMALVNEGIEAATNLASSFILLVAQKMLKSGESQKYPFGTGRIINIANFVISMLLSLTGFEMIIFSMKHLLLEHVYTPNYTPMVLGVIVLFLVLNYWLTYVCFKVARRIQSSILNTEGTHKQWDNVFSLCVLLAGVGSLYGYIWLDSVVAILFGLLILKSSYHIARENVSILLGSTPHPELMEQIVDLGKTIPGVLGIHEIVIHSYGERILVTIHVEMDENMTLKESHKICDQIEDLLQEKLGIYATTHADPYNSWDSAVRIIIEHKQELLTIPDVSLFVSDIGHVYTGIDYHSPDKTFVSLDLFLKQGLNHLEEKHIYELLYKKLTHLLKRKIRLKIRPRPLFGSTITRGGH